MNRCLIPAPVCTPYSWKPKKPMAKKASPLTIQGHSTLFFKLTLFLYEERSKSKPMTLLLASNSLVPSQTIVRLLLSSELAEESEYKRISNQLQRGNLGHDSSCAFPHLPPICSEVDSVTNQLLLKIHPGLSELCSLNLRVVSQAQAWAWTQSL